MKTRKVSDIKADMKSIQDALDVTTDAGEKAMLKEGLDELEKELKEAEAKTAAVSDIKKEKGSSKKKSVKRETYNDFEEKVTRLIEKEQDITRSDAQGIVEAHSAELNYIYEKGYSAERAVIEITSIYSNVRSKKEMEEAFGKEFMQSKDKGTLKEYSEVPKGKAAGKFHLVKEGEKVQHVTKNLELHKISDDLYDLQHKGKSAFEIKKKDGKWHPTCKIKERVKKDGFNSLNAAVIYISKLVYNEDLKEFFQAKVDAAKRSKKFREANPSGSTTAAKDIKKATEKAVEKIEEKAEEGKGIVKDITSIFNSFRKSVEDIREIIKEDKTKVDKTAIKELIAELQKLL